MIIERNIFEVKPFCRDEALAILKAESLAYPDTPSRFQSPVFGSLDQVISEITFESLSAAEDFWANWSKTGAAEVFSKKFDPLISFTGRREVWGVHEPVQLAVQGRYIDWRQCVVKPGMVGNVCQLLANNRGTSNRYDIFFPIYAPLQRVVMVLEFDHFESYFQEWDTWGREKATPEFWEEWRHTTDQGGTSEIWQIA
jgi:hypothetical protein